MDATFMIFYRESDLQHYLYNGTNVLAINPNREFDKDEWAYIGAEPSHKAKLDQALHSKARGFAALARYQIIHRGKFISE